MKMAAPAYRLGVVDINYVSDFLFRNGPGEKEAVLRAARNMFPDQLGHKPFFEIVIYNAPDLNLEDSGKDYLRLFDDLGGLCENVGFEPAILLFTGPGCGAHMASRLKAKKKLAVRFGKSAIDIASHVGARRVNGPFWFEHNYQGASDPKYIVDPMRELSDYADDDVILTPEMLRREESRVFCSLHDALETIRQVGRDNVRFQADTAHLADYGGPGMLIESVDQCLTSEVCDHFHISEYADWNTPTNRGVFIPGGVVHDALPQITGAFVKHGYDGPASVESPHTAFHEALGREDPEELVKAERYVQDQHAHAMTQLCLNRVLQLHLPLMSKE